MAVILVTHDLGVIAGRADRIAVMFAGQIVETATTTALFASPRHRYTEALFQALPDSAAGRLYSIPGLPLTRPPAGCRFAPRCRYATGRCLDEQPPLIGEEPGHQYACFFPVDPPAPPSPALTAGPDPAKVASNGATPASATTFSPVRSQPDPRPASPSCAWTAWSKTSRSPAAPCCSARSGRSARSPTSAWASRPAAARPPSAAW